MDPVGYPEGIQALRFWYDASSLPAIGMVKWYDAVEYYKNGRYGGNGAAIAKFGVAIKGIRIDKIKNAMQRLGHDKGYLYPEMSDFYNYAADGVNSFDVGDAKQVAVETAEAVGSVVKWGSATYLLIAAIPLAILFFNSGGKIAAKAKKYI